MNYITLSANGSSVITKGSSDTYSAGGEADALTKVCVKFLDVVLGEQAKPITALVPLADLEAQLLKVPGFAENFSNANREIADTFLSDAIDLKYYRLKQGLSQSQLAVKLGITQPYVNRLESRKVEPKIGTIIKLAKVLEVSEQDIINTWK